MSLIIVGGAISIIPVENFFVTFESPQEALNYQKSGDMITFCEGSASACIMYESGKTSSGTMFVRKTNNGYNLCSFFEVREVSTALNAPLYVSIYNLKDTNDYYLEMIGIIGEGDIVQVEDSLSTSFDLLYQNHYSIEGRKIVRCLCPINYSLEYQLYINGNKVRFNY
jgi:hypothetical protein